MHARTTVSPERAERNNSQKTRNENTASVTSDVCSDSVPKAPLLHLGTFPQNLEQNLVANRPLPTGITPTPAISLSSPSAQNTLLSRLTTPCDDHHRLFPHKSLPTHIPDLPTKEKQTRIISPPHPQSSTHKPSRVLAPPFDAVSIIPPSLHLATSLLDHHFPSITSILHPTTITMTRNVPCLDFLPVRENFSLPRFRSQNVCSQIYPRPFFWGM
ncbi:hypothetical protein EX30DRAFT_250212 [Ascodesmis nigricans]|uniref:Uncharacterized protein n=1 Tax=Ascodesmis nigricans TaxID=341454 RepID=A0A4S2MY65_9PEZI|nr:hypothetical protein EX30DRAFT_250212 [Ascodesmis nigricans]